MKKLLEPISGYKLILLLLFLALLLRLPWLYTTIERDEGIFGYSAWRLLSGDRMYDNVKDNKPPLLYLLYALPIKLFGNSILYVRMFNNLLFLTSIIFFFFFVKREYGKRIAVFSSIFYIFLMNTPAAEGPLAVSESFMIPFFAASVYFFSLFFKKNNFFCLIISLSLITLASLIRHNALAGLLLFYFLLIKEKKLNWKTLVVMITPLIVFLALVTYFLYTCRYSEILSIITGIHTSIPLNYSLLVIFESSPALLFAFVGVVFALKKKNISEYLFVLLWFMFLIPFTFFPVSFHNLLAFAPITAIFGGIGLDILLKKGWKKELAFIAILAALLILSSFLIIKQYPDYHFKLGQTQITYSCLENYGQQLTLAEYIKNTSYPKDEIFIFGREPAIYWLSNKKRFYSFQDCLHHLQSSSSLPYYIFFVKKIVFLENFDYSFKLNPFSLIEPKKEYNLGSVKVWDNLTCREFNESVGGIDFYYICKALLEDSYKYCDYISHEGARGDCYYFSSLKQKNPAILLDYKNDYFKYKKDSCYTQVAQKRGDASICDNVSESAKNYCKGVVLSDTQYCDKSESIYNREICRKLIGWIKNKESFNYSSCIETMGLKYDQIELQNTFCSKLQAEMTNNTSICEHLNEEKYRIFCKTLVTNEEKSCSFLIQDTILFNFCMAETTLNLDYCDEMTSFTSDDFAVRKD